MKAFKDFVSGNYIYRWDLPIPRNDIVPEHLKNSPAIEKRKKIEEILNQNRSHNILQSTYTRKSSLAPSYLADLPKLIKEYIADLKANKYVRSNDKTKELFRWYDPIGDEHIDSSSYVHEIAMCTDLYCKTVINERMTSLLYSPEQDQLMYMDANATEKKPATGEVIQTPHEKNVISSFLRQNFPLAAKHKGTTTYCMTPSYWNELLNLSHALFVSHLVKKNLDKNQIPSQNLLSMLSSVAQVENSLVIPQHKKYMTNLLMAGLYSRTLDEKNDELRTQQQYTILKFLNASANTCETLNQITKLYKNVKSDAQMVYTVGLLSSEKLFTGMGIGNSYSLPETEE